MNKIRTMDKRVEKTRSAIINSFKEMIIEMEFDKITIKGLAERANINRKTFYLHYDSMEDILFDLTVEVADKLFERLVENDFFNSFDINVLIDLIDSELSDDFNLYKKIFGANSYRFFSRNVKDIVKESFIRKVSNKTKLDNKYLNIVAEYISSGFSKILRIWFEDPNGISQEEITKLACVLIFSGVNGVLSNDIVKNS